MGGGWWMGRGRAGYSVQLMRGVRIFIWLSFGKLCDVSTDLCTIHACLHGTQLRVLIFTAYLSFTSCIPILTLLLTIYWAGVHHSLWLISHQLPLSPRQTITSCQGSHHIICDQNAWLSSPFIRLADGIITCHFRMNVE